MRQLSKQKGGHGVLGSTLVGEPHIVTMATHTII